MSDDRGCDAVAAEGLESDMGVLLREGAFVTAGRATTASLERDDFRMNRHRALAYCLSMIFFGKPVSTPHQVRGRLFPDHARGADLTFASRLAEASRRQMSNPKPR